MTEHQPVSTREDLRAFEARMAREGAAAFANGPVPWESWSDALPLKKRKAQQEDIPQLHRRKPATPYQPGKTAGQRVVTGIAQLSVVALVVGIAGIYFTSGNNEQLADAGSDQDTVALIEPITALPENSPDSWQPRVLIDPNALPAPAAGQPDMAGEVVTDAVEYSDARGVTESWQPHVLIDPNTLPAPAAGQPEIAVVAVTGKTREEAQATLPDSASTGSPAGEAAPIADRIVRSPVPASAPPEPVEPLIALQQPAAAPAPESPAQAVEKAVTPPAPAARTTPGNWVVNLASYQREAVAKRMLDEFRDKGVTAEMVEVTVNDKPMIRVRTTGHDSYREALDWAEMLEERLELEGVWVSKR